MAECGIAGFDGRVFGEGAGFVSFRAGQLPLRDGRLVDQILLGRVLRLVLVLEAGVDFVKILLFFAGQDEGAGAQAVAQVVHGGRGLAFRAFWTRTLLCIAAICRDLFLCCHGVTFSGQSKPMGRACARQHRQKAPMLRGGEGATRRRGDRRRGDTGATRRGRVGSSEFRLASGRMGTGWAAAGLGLQVIEKSGKRGRGGFFADVRLGWRPINVRLCLG